VAIEAGQKKAGRFLWSQERPALGFWTGTEGGVAARSELCKGRLELDVEMQKAFAHVKDKMFVG
jgi:hypothetical protein